MFSICNHGRLKYSSITCGKILSHITRCKTLLTLFCSQSVDVEKETPLEIDAGLLAATDLNPINEESYNETSRNISKH
ncbi:hypothetical protein B0H34DRAFT_713698 [Crassisporium funariophilum]|nr:hypothetical protein B0H34DRAFT_713698 [Crassisporium funariophilum]